MVTLQFRMREEGRDPIPFPSSYQWQRAIAVRASRVAAPRHDWDRRPTRRLPSGRRVAVDVRGPPTRRRSSQSQQAMPTWLARLRSAVKRRQTINCLREYWTTRTTHCTSHFHHFHHSYFHLNQQHHRTITSDAARMTDNCINTKDTWVTVTSLGYCTKIRTNSIIYIVYYKLHFLLCKLQR